MLGHRSSAKLLELAIETKHQEIKLCSEIYLTEQLLLLTLVPTVAIDMLACLLAHPSPN
jgi:hypothetical protein